MSDLAARDARIAVRRARIAARLLAANTVQKDHRKSRAEAEKDAGPGDKQLSKSLHDLANLKLKLNDEVKGLRDAADLREFEHRMTQAEKKENLATRVKLEVQDSNKHNEEISEKWKVVTAIEVPQELAKQIANQRKACDAVLQGKDAVINEMIGELKVKDEEYRLAIEQQSKDIDDLVALMARQVAALNDAHKNELTSIEVAFLQQRQALLASNKEEMSGLIKERLDMETKFQEDMLVRKEEFAKALDDIRDADAEEYNILKVRLESDLQTLEQHHATMQAVYQFNAEKLEYNHLVLVERDHENYITSNQQKRKLNKQRDTLCTLKGRHSELEKRFLEQNSKLTVEFGRVTKLLQDLQNKEHTLLRAHETVRRQFFCMHQRDLAILVSRVLLADKDIHENQLGWHWRAPSDHVLNDLASNALLTADQRKGESKLEVTDDLAETMSQEVYRPLLATLCQEAFFLVDEKTREALPSIPPLHHDWVECLSILQALGIKNGASLEKLRIALHGVDEKLHENSIDNYLRSYLQEEAKPRPTDLKDESEEDDPNGPPGTKLSKDDSARIKWENYWNSFTTVINAKVLRVWGHLENSLTAYNKLLKERVFVTSEVISFRKQNEALKEALHHCLNKNDVGMNLFNHPYYETIGTEESKTDLNFSALTAWTKESTSYAAIGLQKVEVVLQFSTGVANGGANGSVTAHQTVHREIYGSWKSQ